jgi:hypothetical protein
MAKVTGGLFSNDASGMLGGLVLFGKHKAGQTVRRFKKTSVRASNAQIEQRNKFDIVREKWHDATPEQLENAAALAEKLQITTYNAFIKLYINESEPVDLTIWNAGLTVWNSGATRWNPVI